MAALFFQFVNGHRLAVGPEPVSYTHLRAWLHPPRQGLDGQQIALGAQAADLAHADRGGHRAVAKLLPLVDVGDVHLHRRQLDGGQRVADGVAVMGVGAGVDDDPLEDVYKRQVRCCIAGAL